MIERELRYQQQLQEFVLKVIREAVAAEREACARVPLDLLVANYGLAPLDVREAIAAAIRARGQQ